MRPAYRARQFWQALTAAPGREPPCALAPRLAALYRAMPRADRAHGLRTYRRLVRAGQVSAALAAAALLHDVGKAGVRLWDRVLYVLARGRLPGWLARWPGLAALREHAAVGARLVEEAGADDETAALIRHHHDDPLVLGWPAARRALLEALQRADEGS